MHWELKPILGAAVLGLAIQLPGMASGEGLRDVTGVINDLTSTFCRFNDCRSGARPSQPSGNRAGTQSGTSSISSAERARRAAEQRANIDVQNALNGFGFNVGTADGSLGPRSRAAIGEYQSYMGYPSSGFLDDNQRAILLNSYARLQRGEGANYQQIAATEGPRGLLRAFNDPNYIGRYGVSPTVQPGYPNATANGQPGYSAPGYNQPGQGNGPASAGLPNTGAPSYEPPGRANDSAGQAIGAATLGPLGPLDTVDQVASSMTDRCKFVSLTTETNQGPIRVSNMTDPAQALSEQFCEARDYAISVSQNTAAKVRASEAELTSACQQISTAMSPVRALLASQPPEAVAAKAAEVNQRIAPDPSAAATYGQICLGLGYRHDDPEMALSADLLLVGAGYLPFGEMVGHHLREGFGVGQSNGAALPWYKSALTALEGNAQPVFLPSKSAERMEVIRAAVNSGQIRASGPMPLGAIVPISAEIPGGHAISR